VKSDTKTTIPKQSAADIPLFDWRFAVVHPRTTAGTFVVRKYGVTPVLADLIAEAAGLGEGARMSYPNSPGYKSSGTSSIAARRIARHATALRDRVCALLKTNYPASFTSDEIADRLGESILSVRPRVTELLRRGVIIKTESRRKNASGMSAVAVRWRDAMNGEVC
jgi:hypothetical protein